MWLFKTVSGALTSGRFRMCSPARSLEAKPFSVEYWKWQHRYLLDAVNQFGAPSVFLTISLYEWSFPVPSWLSSIRDLTGRGPSQLAAFETTHITHVLEQIIRGTSADQMTKSGPIMTSIITIFLPFLTFLPVFIVLSFKIEVLFMFIFLCG